MLKLCPSCQSLLAPFRFDKGSEACRECVRWKPRAAVQVSPIKHRQAVEALHKDKRYKAYLEEHQLRTAQFGGVALRGCGVVDKK